MNTTTARWFTAVVLLAALLGCKERSVSMPEDDPRSNVLNAEADFFGLLRRVHGNFKPYESTEEMLAEAELVVEGNVVSVSDGRTFYGPSGELGSAHNAVLGFKVSNVIKGDFRGAIAHVEVARSLPTSVESLRTTMPAMRMLLFLVNTADYPQPSVHSPRAGLPDGATLYTLSGPQAMIVDDNGIAVQPLTEQFHQLVGDDEPLSAISERLRP